VARWLAFNAEKNNFYGDERP